MSLDSVTDDAVRHAIEAAVARALDVDTLTRVLDAVLPAAVARALDAMAAKKAEGVVTRARSFLQRLCFLASPPTKTGAPAPDPVLCVPEPEQGRD